jgi:hypothetical protein
MTVNHRLGEGLDDDDDDWDELGSADDLKYCQVGQKRRNSKWSRRTMS